MRRYSWDTSLEPYSRAVSHRFSRDRFSRGWPAIVAYCTHIADAGAIVRSDATLRTGAVLIDWSSAGSVVPVVPRGAAALSASVPTTSTRSPTCGARSESAASSNRYILTASAIAAAAGAGAVAGSAASVMFDSTYLVAPAGSAVVPAVAAGDGADR